ncbi:M20 metallopeptidase family protein [Endomicrobium proavitum]|uniref:Amidohydrolase n=1 Tax=Endomicrobium proavitum TaxID=1408281 RepID=A0A0G3WIU8_9BACT|nr:M20 family metallopeptidase [Endomicrobium proavitum]AKL98238.1 amidohydrolase [Endomicrobium proavitum]
MSIDKEIIQIRRDVHKNPELSGCEYKTAKYIESKLKSFGIPYKRIAKTGVIATIAGNKKGKTIALRADIDALPILEENAVDYKSVNRGIMHACGHDAHVAIMLGAAKLLSAQKESINGSVRFIFQPAEESADGAKNMINDGALKNPKPEIILGLHVCPWIKSGKIGIKYGEMMAAVDKVNIEIKGVIAHGAYPHLGKDAIVAASAFVNSVQSIISREIAPVENAVITFGKISGGQAYNIICDKVTLVGTVRTFNNKTRQIIKKSILNKLKGIEKSYGVKCSADYAFVDEPLINTKKVTQFCHKAAEEFYGKKNVELIEKPSMGGEDFANYLEEVSGNFMYVGTSKDKKTSNPWHHTNFNIDESALPKAAEFVTYIVKKYLK